MFQCQRGTGSGEVPGLPDAEEDGASRCLDGFLFCVPCGDVYSSKCKGRSEHSVRDGELAAGVQPIWLLLRTRNIQPPPLKPHFDALKTLRSQKARKAWADPAGRRTEVNSRGRTAQGWEPTNPPGPNWALPRHRGVLWVTLLTSGPPFPPL